MDRQEHSRTVDGRRHHHWTDRLWEAARDLPVVEVAVDDVAELDQDCWFRGRAPTCREVAEHARRIQEADLRLPVVLAADGTLMDGGHRVCRAWLEGRATVPAVRFAVDPLPDRVTDDEPAADAVGPSPAATDHGPSAGPVLTDAELRSLAGRLVEVAGVVGVMLGGSRARGAERPDSDVDLGLYHRAPLDVERLQRLADEVAEARPDQQRAAVTQPGAWGPWVDGGAWLTIAGTPVDWIYRDLDRVHRSCADARAGRFDVHAQVGHPFGVPGFAYAGEVALGVVLADPTGELAALKQATAVYPPALARTVVERLAEADFLLGALGKPAARGDVAVVAGSLFRVVGLCAHALHARAGRWVINEKGLVDAASGLPGAPPDFGARCRTLLGRLGTGPAGLVASVKAARVLLTEVAVG